MKLHDFFWHVESDDGLRGVDISIGDNPEVDAITVEDTRTGYKTTFRVPVILELEWDKLQAIATGEERIDPLYHISRIVGYYSRIENWNKSKLGELSDRRAGRYAIPETF